MKTYLLKPVVLDTPVAPNPFPGKPADPATNTLVATILPPPAPPAPAGGTAAQARKFIPLPPRQPLPQGVVDPARPLLKLGLDVHLEFIMAVGQRDHANPQAPRKFTREELVAQVQRCVAEGLQVFCVQESCGFGFVLHRALVDAGAQSFLITPVALNGQRKTDKLDARALCLRLSRWLDGNRAELSPIRIPSEAEQRKREGTRRRKFLGRLIRMLGNRGHGQGGEYAHVPLPGRWWGARHWKKLEALDPWLRARLAELRHVILELEAQRETLEAELVARVQEQALPKGLGELTVVSLDGEVCDWERFHNRKQIGSYTGCCPGEHSSGGKRLLGSIDRMGNARVRTLLVEAVWRLLRWQPGWKAAQGLKVKLAGGSALKKKTVVALARRLAIDLWRWRTGRATLADLGWIAA